MNSPKPENQLLIAQKKIDLSDLKEFNNAGGNWHIAGDVKADFNKSHDMTFSPGVGILVNLPNPTDRKDLFTNLKHGDIDLELDCMMAKGSNSGIYLQGRYEIQLLDSWGVLNPSSADIGGIYERYDNSRPEGQRNIEGHAPRQNASKAPGLWQHLKISFQAPKFEGSQGYQEAIQNSMTEPVKREPIVVDAKINRNEPCPCGSGKKYKQCHGK